MTIGILVKQNSNIYLNYLKKQILLETFFIRTRCIIVTPTICILPSIFQWRHLNFSVAHFFWEQHLINLCPLKNESRATVYRMLFVKFEIHDMEIYFSSNKVNLFLENNSLRVSTLKHASSITYTIFNVWETNLPFGKNQILSLSLFDPRSNNAAEKFLFFINLTL